MVFLEPEEITQAKKLLQDGKFTEALQLVDDLEEKEDISQNENYYIVSRSTTDGHLIKVFESKTHPKFAFYLYYIS